MKQNVSLQISIKREAGVQQSLPPCTLLSPTDHPASVLCRDAGESLLCSQILLWASQSLEWSPGLCLGQAVGSHTEFRILVLISSLPTCSYVFKRNQFLEISREGEATKAVPRTHPL